MKRHLENNSNPPALTCWQREAPTACLRLATADGEVHLFPYGQLVTASLVTTDPNETMRITFATHEVEIAGRNLRPLLHALQDFGVKWIRSAPTRYQTLAGADECFVSSIRIISAVKG
jgi:hypothetical protein